MDPMETQQMHRSLQELISRDGREWVEKHLPVGLPPGVRRNAFRHASGENLEPDFHKRLLLNYQAGALTASDLEALRFQLFRSACCEAARCVEQMDRTNEMARWRYVPCFRNGESFFLENLEYVYNTTYDYRKPWFEFQLLLERTTLPESWVKELGLKYEAALNHRFLSPHWRWDSKTAVFQEISSSKWVDGSGVEQPNPAWIRGLTEKYTR